MKHQPTQKPQPAKLTDAHVGIIELLARLAVEDIEKQQNIKDKEQ